jgi:hypothetical protein
MPHSDLWSAVEYKQTGAEFFFKEMGRDIQPPHLGNPTMVAIVVSTGAIVGSPWQERFYHHLDAFLTMARSIPEIIQCNFGLDPSPSMRRWISNLNSLEEARRRTFQDRFDPLRRMFGELPLSGARNITLHRTGVPPVMAQVIGRWGTYTGSPLTTMPQSELLPIVAGNDPALQWAATEPPQPVQPRAADFSLVLPVGTTTSRVELFPECRAFLEASRKLISDAKNIADAVHGSQPLTPPL